MRSRHIVYDQSKTRREVVYIFFDPLVEETLKKYDPELAENQCLLKNPEGEQRAYEIAIKQEEVAQVVEELAKLVLKGRGFT